MGTRGEDEITWRLDAAGACLQLRGCSRPQHASAHHGARTSPQARAFNDAYEDAKKIRKHLLGSTTYHKNQDDGVEFVVAVKAIAYPGGVCSVWIYFGLIDTDLSNN